MAERVVIGEIKVSPEDMRRGIAQFREVLSGYIRQQGKDPADYLQIMLDRGVPNSKIFSTPGLRDVRAAKMLYYLEYVEARIGNIVEATDLETLRQCALNLAGFLLDFSWCFHELTVVDHESQIDTGEKVHRANASRRNAWNATRHAERAAEWNRWNKCAALKWAAKPTRSKLNVAALVKTELVLSEMAPTIAKKLKKPGTSC